MPCLPFLFCSLPTRRPVNKGHLQKRQAALTKRHKRRNEAQRLPLAVGGLRSLLDPSC